MRRSAVARWRVPLPPLLLLLVLSTACARSGQQVVFATDQGAFFDIEPEALLDSQGIESKNLHCRATRSADGQQLYVSQFELDAYKSFQLRSFSIFNADLTFAEFFPQQEAESATLRHLPAASPQEWIKFHLASPTKALTAIRQGERTIEVFHYEAEGYHFLARIEDTLPSSLDGLSAHLLDLPNGFLLLVGFERVFVSTDAGQTVTSHTLRWDREKRFALKDASPDGRYLLFSEGFGVLPFPAWSEWVVYDLHTNAVIRTGVRRNGEGLWLNHPNEPSGTEIDP